MFYHENDVLKDQENVDIILYLLYVITSVAPLLRNAQIDSLSIYPINKLIISDTFASYIKFSTKV